MPWLESPFVTLLGSSVECAFLLSQQSQVHLLMTLMRRYEKKDPG